MVGDWKQLVFIDKMEIMKICFIDNSVKMTKFGRKKWNNISTVEK